MASTSHPSRILYRGGPLLCALFFLLSSASKVKAAFTSQFTLSAGEEYNDNIFLSTNKEYDFVTFIRPALTLQYALPSQFSPTLTFTIAPIGQIYARHSDQNSFGFGQGGGGSMAYAYTYSPRLSFNFSDVVSTQGKTRVAFQGPGGVSLFPGGTPSPGVPIPPAGYQRAANAFSLGQSIDNSFSAHGQFLYSPNITITGGYDNYYSAFLTAGGYQINNDLNIRGVYHWGQNHNPHAGFGVSVIKDRNGDSNIVYNLDIGDNYFSSQQIQLTPTLTLSFSTGLSFNLGKNGGPRVANNSTFQLIKLWERAQLAVSVHSGLTPSYGVGGISQTTTVSGNFNILLAERLTGFAYLNYALFNSSNNAGAFVAGAGLQYLITRWLSSSLRYGHLITNCCNQQAGQKNFSTGSRVNSNSVLLGVSAYFDVWPHFGLGTALPYPSLFPGVPPQLSVPYSPTTQPVSPTGGP
jgi:hypothetical protein